MTTNRATEPTTATRERPLNARQKGFCRNVVANGGNATKAYEDAGYSPNGAKVSASKLLTNPNVQAEIARIRRDVETETAVDRAYVITKLREIAENAVSESARVRSLELLGKTQRMFVEVAESTVTHDVDDLRQFSEGDLLAMLEQARSVEGDTIVTASRMIDSGDAINS